MNLLQKTEATFNNPRLATLAQYGIGMYHAGLQEDDKKHMLELYQKKVLSILIATSSLAWGVNLPAKAT